MRTPKRPYSRVFGLFACVMLVLQMFAGINATAQEGKILRVHQDTYPDIVDPQQSSFTSEIAVLALSYEGLTRQDENLETVGAAAESWEFNEDQTVLTFHLREGLTYSDGSPLTAERFRYAVERNCDPNVAGEYQSILFDIVGCEEFANSLSEDAAAAATATPAGGATPVGDAYEAAKANLGVRAIDDLTLEITLKAPAPYFPTVASLWVFFPAKQELIEQGGAEWWKNPELQIGNGPFQLTGIEENQLVSFAANENYWGGRPLLDGIEYVYQGESAVALEAYRAGDLDIVYIDPSLLPSVQGDPALADQLVSYPVASTFTLTFNLAQEPFNDKKVREAFAYAFDRETYCAEIRSGDCTPTEGWVPEGIAGSIETDAYAFDPAAAVQALAESTYGGPEGLPEIQLFYNSNDSANTARAEWVAGQYQQILGVTLTLVPTEGTALTELRKDSSTHPQLLLVGGWIQDYPDPQNWLSVYWKCDATFAQRFGYCNPELDAILEQADAEADTAARTALYEQASELLVADAPAVFLYNLSNNVLVNPNVTGYTPTALDLEWPGQFTSLLTLDKTGE